MDIGIVSLRDPRITTRLTGMLVIPFLQDKDVYVSINGPGRLTVNLEMLNHDWRNV
ncbi:MAG: hypothetical protein JAZ17_05415 [Candidatus Thiodiazotropha endolucinida]|nr:hypothetical protein [Candidatus Thiodiazotropha endolucinida]